MLFLRLFERSITAQISKVWTVSLAALALFLLPL